MRREVVLVITCIGVVLQPEARPTAIDQRPPLPAAYLGEAEATVELDRPVQVADEELGARQQGRPRVVGNRPYDGSPIRVKTFLACMYFSMPTPPSPDCL